MNIEEVRNYALSLPGTTERCPFGPDTLSIEVCGRIFVLMTLAGEWDFYNLKANPDYAVELRDRYRGIQPGYHMNKRHWISVDFSSDVPDDLQRSLIDHSYRQVVSKLPRKVRLELDLPVNLSSND